MALPEVVKEAIENGRFRSLLCGINGYENRDRYDPSPINYRLTLDSLYELIKEDKNTILIFTDTLNSICVNSEGIYIAAHYVYWIIFDIASGICDINFDIKTLTDNLSEAIEKNREILKNTKDLFSLPIHSNLYNLLVEMDEECFIKNKVHLFHQSDNPIIENTFVPTKEVVNIINKDILNGSLTPHGVSKPVLFKEDDKLYIAVFLFFFPWEGFKQGLISRPAKWALSDILTGKIVAAYYSKEKEFSDAPYEEKYNVCLNGKNNVSEGYYEKAYSLLDKVRKHYLESGEVLKDCYNEYLKMILDSIPDDIQRFYIDLNNI